MKNHWVDKSKAEAENNRLAKLIRDMNQNQKKNNRKLWIP